MTPSPSGWDEAHLAEDPAVELLRTLGYTYVAPETLESERQSPKGTVLAGRLATALRRLNPWLSDVNVTRTIKAVTNVPAASLAEGNEKLHVTLTYGIALEQDRGDGTKAHTVRFFDFDDPTRNDWLVTRQFRVLGTKKHVVADVAVFGNGIPLAIIECKSPTIGDKWKALSREQQDRLVERFKDRGDPLALLVVCDMLLTGFDAPVEQVLYLDSPLREHNLLQAIARVNRTADRKDYGLVVDYWGISSDLQNALTIFSSADVQGALASKVDQLPRLQSRHAAAMRFFQAVRNRNDLDEHVKVLEPEDVRAELELAFRPFSSARRASRT